VLVSELPGGRLLIVAAPIGDRLSTLSRLLWLEGAITGVALGAALVLAWWLVEVGLRPLREVERTATAITHGDLTRRVPFADERSDVGRVAGALNAMLGRIAGAFAERDETEAALRASQDRLRQFVADASHELRTPIAAVSAYAQLFESGAVRDEQELARVMAGIETTTDRMARLVEDLLLLARLDERPSLDREPVELVGLAVEAIETARALGGAWPVQLRASGPVEVAGDWQALRQVIDNLLANARSHTPAGTPITVSVEATEGEALLEVADEGPGLATGSEERLFERFYRGDASRSRATGGAGLGLAIVASIATALGATVHAGANERAEHGAAFQLRLPLLGDENLSVDDEPVGPAGDLASTRRDAAE
jgi:two-component system OmpR family sensor kinase